jgi:type III restriction enzyme
MLQEIINLQQDAVLRLVSELKTDKEEITFKAPTGSGKTFMMADFMNKVIAKIPETVFLVSSLSKSDLAQQNYEKFVEYNEKNFFDKLNPYLINSDIAGEERLYIPIEHNVYLLPRDLYKKGSRLLMQGSMTAFLNELSLANKLIYWIKDECHIATKNLDEIAKAYFKATINFSATPKLSRKQYPDVEIKDVDAQSVKLIKTVTWGDETDTVADAINKFEDIKEDYRNLLGVNPCLIIQISNKDKADEELENIIMPALNAKPHIKWMLIVDDHKQCNTNDSLKAKKIPVSKWKGYAKGNTANIDVIIFKMVISEGWDIPRACMLYQVRDTTSKQLDEQVIGRIRRNPRLMDFETLNERAQELAMTAWVWGVMPEDGSKVYGVKLWDDPQDITNNFKIKTTKLKPLTEKIGFNIKTFLSKQKAPTAPKSIFEIAKELRQTDNQVRDIIYDYATDYSKWWKIAGFVKALEIENKQYKCDYAESMELAESDVSFSLSSHYTDTNDYIRISDWVWMRRDEETKFSFDSKAERDWADILRNLTAEGAVASQIINKNKKRKGIAQEELFEEIGNDGKKIYLWGKNYVPNSVIKFEYYMNAVHSSLPDFVMKDKFNRIHIFEVKSVNESDKYNFNKEIYIAKIEELKKCYKQASILTAQIFYLPILKGTSWRITRFINGKEETITEDIFTKSVKTS